MDSDNLVPTDEIETAHQNGVHEEDHASGEDAVVSNSVNVEKTTESTGLNGSLENAFELDGTVTNNLSIGEIREGSNLHGESNGLTASKEVAVEDADHIQVGKSQKGLGKGKNEKPSNPKTVAATQVKKGKGGKDVGEMPTVSNGSAALNSQSKQPLKSKSFYERQVVASKHSEKSDAVASEGLMDKAKLTPLKKGPANKAEGDAQSSSSPTAESAKPRKVGTLPNYGFSFKCDERAEKRKEFYTKLEEKIQAKEVEKNNLQAKSKETQEAEIKLLRKSLTFKATPMPSFYQEPPPPKVELKKIPTTRAKSPKLGRRKSSSLVDSEGNNGQNSQPGRLSLDEKVSRNNATKGISPVHLKKPQRKSLPKLPSEKTTLSNAVKDGETTLSKATNDENVTSTNQNEAASPTLKQEAVPRAEASEIQPQPEDLVVGEQAQQQLVQA